MSLLMCLSFILPCITSAKTSLTERDINVNELGMMSYEEKVEQIKEQFSNIETNSDENYYYFSGDIDYSQFDFLSTENEDNDVVKSIDAKLSLEGDTVEISNNVLNNGECVFAENLNFSTNYCEETDQLYIIDDNGNKIDILNELNSDNMQECFFLTAALSFVAALTIKQVVAIVVVAVAVVVTTAVVVETINNSDVIDRNLDRLLNKARDGFISFWDRIKLACGKITAVALSTTISLTAELAEKLYEKTKDKKDCYLLCGTITGNGFIPIKYKLTNYENAVNWIRKGGSVWSPFSYTAEKCISGAGYIPGIVKRGIPETFVAERHNISFEYNGVQIDYGFYHYHALNGALAKVGGIHSFFGQPFSGSPVK